MSAPGGPDLRILTTILTGGAVGCSMAQSLPESYSVLLKDDGYTWCAYKDPEEFKSAAAMLQPTDSARITYSSNELTELTYQVEAESGDWIVVDKYTPADEDVLLRRANLLAQENLQIIQETSIHEGKALPFRIVSVSTLDGKTAELPKVNFPVVPVKTDLSASPFVRLVMEIRSQSIGKLCKRIN
jgi:hypothetical protein